MKSLQSVAFKVKPAHLGGQLSFIKVWSDLEVTFSPLSFNLFRRGSSAWRAAVQRQLSHHASCFYSPFFEQREQLLRRWAKAKVAAKAKSILAVTLERTHRPADSKHDSDTRCLCA